MPKKNSSSPVPAAVSAQPADPPPAAGAPAPIRLTLAHVIPATAFPVIGGVLHLASGMPVSDVFTFLAGCGGIGAAVTVAVTGGRRMVGITHALLTAALAK